MQVVEQLQLEAPTAKPVVTNFPRESLLMTSSHVCIALKQTVRIINCTDDSRCKIFVCEFKYSSDV